MSRIFRAAEGYAQQTQQILSALRDIHLSEGLNGMEYRARSSAEQQFAAQQVEKIPAAQKGAAGDEAATEKAELLNKLNNSIADLKGNPASNAHG